MNIVTAPTPVPAAMERPKSRPLVWTLLLIGIVQCLGVSGRVSNSDAASMLELTRSLLSGTIVIPDTVVHVAGNDGAPVCHFGLLTSLWWLPFVSLGRLASAVVGGFARPIWEEFMVSFSPVPVSLALLGYLAAFWRAAGLDDRRVCQGLLLVAFTTLLWPYSKLIGSDLPMALAIVAAVYHAARDKGTRGWALAGLWLGAAILSRKQAQIVVPWVLLCLTAFAGAPKTPWTNLGPRLRWAWTGWSWIEARPRLLPLAVGLLPGVVLQLAYNRARFGGFLIERYAGSATGDISFQPLDFADRLLRLLLGDSRGLIIYALVPLLMLALSRRDWIRDHLLSVWVVAGLAAANLGFFACYAHWAGGTSAGPRLLLFLTPLLALTWAGAAKSLDSPATRTAFVSIACLAGLAIQLPLVLVDPLAAQRRSESATGISRSRIANYWLEVARTLGVRPRNSADPLPKDDVLNHPQNQHPDIWWIHAAAEIHRRSQPGRSPGP